MDLVLIEWIDAVYHDLWESIDEIEPTSMVVQSVGWIAKRTPHYITIIPHRQDDQTRGGMTIPRLTINRIVKLAPSGEDFEETPC